MIVAVCADKGGAAVPLGVSTLVLALARHWPGQRLVLEADPSGGDALFRLTHADGGPLQSEPTLLSLAADARNRLDPRTLPFYAQPTGADVAVIVSPPTAEMFTPVGRFWPGLAEAASEWDGTVVADLGRLGPAHHAASAVLPRADVVLLLVRADVAGLYRMRDRVSALATVLAATGSDTPRLAVAVRTPRSERTRAIAQVQELLDSIGSPVPIAGTVVDDEQGAACVWTGRAVGRPGRSRLHSCARALVEALLALPLWPPVPDQGGRATQADASPHDPHPVGEAR